MKKYIVISLVVMLNYACSTEDTNEDQQTDNFYALTVGNSWEYKYYLRDANTNAFVGTSVNETVDITTTVTINSNTYYNFKHTVNGNDGSYTTLPSNGERNYTLRDSLGYLIDEIGRIRYNNSNYNEHFVDYNTDLGAFAQYLELSQTMDDITTNAGSFTCYDNHFFFRDLDGNLANSLDNVYREDGKGEVLSTLSNMSDTEPFAEKRLEGYSIE